jgi:pre-rRNA-processing protein IPI3
MWSLQPPFDLLATFTLPPGTVPTALAVDPTERFAYAASTQGDVYHIPLFKRKGELGQVEAIGGDGPGAAGTKLGLACVSVE